MDYCFKALLTTATVALVLWLTRRCGLRIAGLVAALPTVTAPTLAWLAIERGPGFAVAAAVASVAACSMLAAFALAYAAIAQRGGGPALSLGAGLLAASAMAWPAFAASTHLPAALVLALFGTASALRAMPSEAVFGRPRLQAAAPLTGTAVVAGASSALAATLGPLLGSFAAGLLSSLPVASGAVAIIEHASAGPQAAVRFLRGYAGGLYAKAFFGTTFALLALPLGTPSALAAAGACTLLATWAAARRQVPAAACRVSGASPVRAT